MGSSMVIEKKQIADALLIAEELYKINKTTDTKLYYVNTIKWAVDKSKGIEKLKLLLRLLFLDMNFKYFIKRIFYV